MIQNSITFLLKKVIIHLQTRVLVTNISPDILLAD